MLESIFIGMSGLQSFSKGLKVISNNVANMNTAGFKSSDLSFGSLYYQNGGQNGDANAGNFGTGVGTLGTYINFASGDVQQTNNPLDLSIDGSGYFAIKNPEDGSIQYSRAGQFEFDQDGVLVVRGTGRQVLGYGTQNSLASISLDGLRVNPPKSTSVIKFVGNLSTGVTDFAIDSVSLIDAAGGQHTVKLSFKKNQTSSGSWDVTMTDGAKDMAVGHLNFSGITPDPTTSALSFTYTPEGQTAFDIKLDFSDGVTSYSTGTTSNLAVSSSDGLQAGVISSASFDKNGILKLSYSNGQTGSGAQLALARFEFAGALEEQSGGNFSASDGQQVQLGHAGENGLGNIASSSVEGSNVDLSTEFSELIIMQRGYQASSQIVTTANEMLQQLFDMKGGR